MASLVHAGFQVNHNPSKLTGHAAIVNTCGFIGDAKEESIEMILSLVKAKQSKKIDKIFVMGCLSQRYFEELKAEIPEVDGWYGKFDWNGIAKILSSKQVDETTLRPWNRIITTPAHSAYIKISEGCNRKCAFCAIPIITGPHHSRPMNDILEETRKLVQSGVKEFNVIAQDLSSYGLDLTHRQQLPELIDAMSQISGVEWIRLHYAYPSQFPIEIMDVMNVNKNVCRYIDVALQHINDNVLTNMRRHITSEQTYRLLDEIRSKVPDIHIRTTLMVGFPGEGEKEFEELLDFTKTIKFERMGAFAYSEEEDTWAAKKFKDLIPSHVKQQRLDALMALQQNISDEIQSAKIGKTLKVLIDKKDDGIAVGRTEWDSPEVDPEVIIKSNETVNVGNFYDVRIKDSTPFELHGEVV